MIDAQLNEAGRIDVVRLSPFSRVRTERLPKLLTVALAEPTDLREQPQFVDRIGCPSELRLKLIYRRPIDNLRRIVEIEEVRTYCILSVAFGHESAS